MQNGGDRKHHRVDLGDQVIEGGEGLCAVLLGDALSDLLVAVEETDEVSPRQLAKDADMVPAHGTGAHDTDPQPLSHGCH